MFDPLPKPPGPATPSSVLDAVATVLGSFDKTDAAPDSSPVPSGEYETEVADGRLIDRHRKNGDGEPIIEYVVRHRITAGDNAGKYIWHNIPVTTKARGHAIRDLNRYGIDSLHRLDKPFPPGVKCRVRVELRKSESGTEFNKVRSVTVTATDLPKPDPDAPPGISPPSSTPAPAPQPSAIGDTAASGRSIKRAAGKPGKKATAKPGKPRGKMS